MAKHRKTWTTSQKMEVINYFDKWGLTKTSREYNVSASSIYKWKTAYEEEGTTGLVNSLKTNEETKEFKRLKRENEELKK